MKNSIKSKLTSCFTLLQKRSIAYYSLVLIHTILALIAFNKHFLNPLNTVFCNWGDGSKNNFTLLSFVKEPIGGNGIFKYGMMNYPFGDYVYATDNTPLFSVPFRWFCHHIYDISAYTLPIFNFLMIANILICGLLVFFIFKRIIKSTTLAWVLAIILPWTNLQVPRLFRGHYNLSLSSLCVITLILFYLWSRYHKDKTKRLLIFFSSLIFCYCCFFIHGYYIAMIPVYLSCMILFFGIIKVFQRDGGLRSILFSILLISLTGLLCIGTMLLTDGYFSLRKVFAGGYDWMEQKTNFSLLFTHYNFQKVVFPFTSTKDPNDIELMVYLGNIGLYAISTLFVVSFFSQKFRLTLWEIQKEYFKDPLKSGIAFAGLILFSMSIGENYYPLMNGLKLAMPVAVFAIPIAEIIFLLLIFSIICYSIYLLIKDRSVNQAKMIQPHIIKHKLWKAALFYIISICLLFFMFGRYDIWYWVNMTNPLWMLHKFTRAVEQFRSLVRFAWPFYWSYYIWIMFTVSALYLRMNKNGKLLIIALMFFFGGGETIDYILELKKDANFQNPLSREALKPMSQLQINFKDYQAILPIPYYNAGSEDGDNTLDDLRPWSEFSFQLSTYCKLPLMSGKMSRTPPVFASALINLIIDTIPNEIKKKLNSKPILITVDRAFLNDSTISVIPDRNKRPKAALAYWKSNDFTNRHTVKLIDSLGSVYFYEWDWWQKQEKALQTSGINP